MAQAPRDENRVTAILGVSDADGETTVPIYADPDTNRLYVDALSSSDSSSVATRSEYSANDIDDGDTAANILYIGMESADGTWFVFKFDETSSTLIPAQYASVKNNAGTTTYSTAWTNRATLTYGDYSVAF